MDQLNLTSFDFGEIDDALLVEHAQAGNSKALNALLKKYESFVYNCVSRVINNRENALDAVQDILIKAVSGISNFQKKSSFRTWLYRIAINHTLDVKSRANRNSQMDFEIKSREIEWLGSVVSKALEDDDCTGEANINLLLTGLLICLNEQQQKAILLRDVFNLSNQEASALLNISIDNFRQQVSRARRDLKKWMVKHKEAYSDLMEYSLASDLGKTEICMEASAMLSKNNLQVLLTFLNNHFAGMRGL